MNMYCGTLFQWIHPSVIIYKIFDYFFILEKLLPLQECNATFWYPVYDTYTSSGILHNIPIP